MNFGSVASVVLIGLIVLAAAGWMAWTIRQAVLARRGPSATPGHEAESYLRHDKATGGVATFVAIAGVVLTGVISPDHPLWYWPGAIAGILAIVTCERRWPRPSGAIRSAVVEVRRPLSLVPWFGVALSTIGLLSAGIVISICWMLGNTPDGHTISGNKVNSDPDAIATIVTADDFPGWPSGLAALLGGVALLLTVALGWWLVAHRPTLRGISTELDTAFRRSNIDRMVRIVGIAAFLTTNDFYETARSAYYNLQVHKDLFAPAPDQPFTWISPACAILVLITWVAGRSRPRLPRTNESAPVAQSA